MKNAMTGSLRAALLAACALAGGYAAGAQAAYPDHAITMIVPLAAGSAVDNAARLVAQEMSKDLGVAVVVENQPGAAGIIGADRVSKAAPDGYTLGGYNDSILTMVPNMQANMPWDPVRDFTPVSLATTFEWGLVTTPSLNYKSAGDFIAAAKAAPGKLHYGTGGIGSPQHIAMALFAARNGLDVVHVPYKGASQAAVGVAAGEVQAAFEAIPTVKSLVDGKKLDLVGVCSEKELAQLPGVKTISASGSVPFTFESWFVVVAPKKTPAAIVDRLNASIKKALANPDVRQKLAAQGAVPRGSSPKELGDLTKSQLQVYKKLIDDNHIKVD
ncbi:Bug family tripartite tricarboxylate transporter substrate binding protein [Achromobacter aloeverae]|nr:tripartite tricarboxylate transporter substrate binding protein [Achromobacter aloeverae]